MRRAARAIRAITGLLVLLAACTASAATGEGTLAAAAASADFLHVSCFDDGSGPPASLTAQVSDLAPTADPFVSVQLRKGDAATNGTDPVDGDGTPGPTVWIDGGPGDYDVFVDKSGAGQETYRLTLLCKTGAGGGGVTTGTQVAEWPASVPVAGALGRLIAVAALTLAAGWRLRRRRVLIALLVAAVSAAALPASAHTQNGSLGAAAAATDYYQVTCFDNGSGAPESLGVQLLDATSGALPLVSVQLQRGSQLVNASDTVAADATPGPAIFLNLGAGVYNVLIDKTGAGSKSYGLSFHCYTGPDGSGLHTGTGLSARQNQ